VESRLKVNLPSFITPPGDKKLKKNIKTVLEINRDIDISDLELTVSNGVVRLDGFVDAYWKKVKAETIVYDVVGVGDIVNNLTIVPTENYIDKEIAHDISSAIKRNFKVNVDNLDIKVNNGKVYISGLVSDRVAYIAAIESVENTAGVISIEDNIMIGE